MDALGTAQREDLGTHLFPLAVGKPRLPSEEHWGGLSSGRGSDMGEINLCELEKPVPHSSCSPVGEDSLTDPLFTGDGIPRMEASEIPSPP